MIGSTSTKVLWHCVAAVFMMSIFLTAGCSSDETAEQTSEVKSPEPPPAFDSSSADREDSVRTVNIKYQPTHIPWDLNTPPETLAGVIFNPASQWEVAEPTGDKIAYYKYAPVLGDSVGAEMSVYHFGAGPGNWRNVIDRWINQMSYNDRRTPQSAALQHDRVVGGMNAHVLSILGTYSPPGEGFDRENAPSRDGHRVIGVAVEGPQGHVYFKLTGPDSTARVMTEAFMNMIYRLQPAP